MAQPITPLTAKHMDNRLYIRSGQLLARLEVLVSSTKSHTKAPCHTVDFTISRCQAVPEDGRDRVFLDVSDRERLPDAYMRLLAKAFDFIYELERRDATANIRLVFSSHTGYVFRCDFLERRFENCVLTNHVTSFLAPLQQVKSFNPHELDLEATSVTWMLSGAVGGFITINPGPEHRDDILSAVDREIEQRLAFPWVSSMPIPRRRVLWVQGREDFDSISRAYEAAWALGITLVIMDQEGHWLQDDKGPYAYLREAFVPASIAADTGLPDRIVDVARAYPHKIDGIVTISDGRLESVAKACEILGMPTEPASAYAIACDKGSTRLLEDTVPGDFTAVVSSAEELDALLAARKDVVPFPLIVKPCLGWNSDCVAKVRTVDELRAAVTRACDRHANGPKSLTRAVIEPYVPGPEVDANFVILDGETLWLQVLDDFPCTGDTADAALSEAGKKAPNFMETIMLLPTGLPTDEQAVLKTSLEKSVAKQGFRSGVMHCEARVRGSRASYVMGQDGVMDLQVQEKSEGEASCYLHEVNARPPGYCSSKAVMLAHGVDFYAVRLLLALIDDAEPENVFRQGVRALSVPYGHNAAGTQYTLGIALLPAKESGVMETEDAVGELLEREDGRIKKWAADWQTMRKGGSRVYGPGEEELWYLGYVSVMGRDRRVCLERVKEVQDKFTYKLRDG